MKYVDVDPQRGVILLSEPMWSPVGNTLFNYYDHIEKDISAKISNNTLTTADMKLAKTQIYYIIASTYYDNIFPNIYDKIIAAKKTTITQKDFTAFLINYLGAPPPAGEVIKTMFSMFLMFYGSIATKNDIAKSLNTKDSTKELPTYKAPLSQKYQIPDVTNIIYSGISPQKLKTLFTECKQMLLVEYNETRIKKSKKDATVKPFDLKVHDYDPATKMIQFKESDLASHPLFKTTVFYITPNNQAFYQVTPGETTGGIVYGKVYADAKETVGVNSGDMVSAAETFGARYDILAKPAESRQSTFWKKLKKVSDIVGTSGSNSIFKTAAGSTVSSLMGGFDDIRTALDKKWLKFPWEHEPDIKGITPGLDAHIRYTIFLMFRDYLDYKIDKISIRLTSMTNVIPVLADHMQHYDEFVRWQLEVTNFIMADYISEFPEQKREAELVRKYIAYRGFFTGGNPNFKARVADAANAIGQTTKDLTKDTTNFKSNPKVMEIVGVEEKSLIDDFVKYCRATRIVS